MKSVRSIYKIGVGPSSSHTMGPTFAARKFAETYPSVEQVKVILYGSLSKTGKGHGTDRAIIQALIFIDLRDRTGIVQLAFDDTTDRSVFDKAFGCRAEYVVCVSD